MAGRTSRCAKQITATPLADVLDWQRLMPAVQDAINPDAGRYHAQSCDRDNDKPENNISEGVERSCSNQPLHLDSADSSSPEEFRNGRYADEDEHRKRRPHDPGLDAEP